MIFVKMLESVDGFFLGVYTIEFVLKLHTHGRGYWFNGFNVFDFLILMFSHIQLVLSQTGAKDLGVIKVMRSLRALRPLRSVSLIGGLQVVVTALIATLSGSFIHIIFLLTLLMFVYGIGAFYCFGIDADGNLNDYWGSFGNSFLSLFVLVTAEGWGLIEKNFNESGVPTYASQSFLISFIFMGHLIFGNLFVAVVIEQIDRATAGYQLKLDLKKSTVIAKKRKRAKNEQESEIKQLLEKQTNLGFSNYPHVVVKMYHLMRSDEYKVLWGMKSNFMWVQMFSNEFNYLTNRCLHLTSLHKEVCVYLGEALGEMDESVQDELMERAVREQMLIENQDNRRRNTFFGRRTTIATLLPFAFSRTGQDDDLIYDEDLEPVTCVACLQNLFNNCICANPDRLAREEELAKQALADSSSDVSSEVDTRKDSLASWINDPQGSFSSGKGPALASRLRNISLGK